MVKDDLKDMSLNDLKKLQKDVDKAIKNFEERQRKEALAAADEAARKLGYSLSELTGAKKTKSKAPAKYAHPENPSLTWTGRGRQPVWYKEALKSGKKEEDLLIR